MTDLVLKELEDSKAEIQDRLFEYLRIPSVSTDPSYEEGMRTVRELLKTRLDTWGLRNIQELDAGGHPCVYGEWLGAEDKPTLLVYGHYDVQPPDPIDLWESPAFEPTIRDGKLMPGVCPMTKDHRRSPWKL
jgi:acetylornithine deacetylase/succinyl-diaminopimelate desuccinylase-like protein